MATDSSAKFIGDLTLNMLQNKISRSASGAENPILDARIPKAAGLEGVSDPYERIYSALSSHIEKYGMNDNLTRQFESLARNVADDPSLLSKYHVKQALSAYRQGISMHEASLKSATKSVPEVVDTSKFATETPEEMAERLRIEKTSAETDARIKKNIDETKPTPLTEAEIAERKAKQDELFRKKPVDEAPPSKLRRNINRPQTLGSSRSCASRNSKIKIKGWQNWF